MNPEQEIQELKNRIEKLSSELKEFKDMFLLHQHDESDGSRRLVKYIRLEKDQTIKIADCEIGQQVSNIDSDNEVDFFAIAVGRDTRSGVSTTSKNAQLSIVHQPGSTVSYISGVRPPLYTPSGTASVTSGGSTVTLTGFTFTVNELAGALININDSSGNLVETQYISSNTSSVVTITGTWLNTTSGGTATIFFPMYLGISNSPWQRCYVMDGTNGGIRFGGGTTNSGQNGLLYMDSSGDLYWRNKAGSSTKLN